MGDHFPHEIGADIVIGAGGVHSCQHGAYDSFHLLPVAAEGLGRVGLKGIRGQDRLHICDALCLLHHDPFRNLPKRNASGVLQDILRHLNCRPMVRDHLDDKILRDAVSQGRVGYAPAHLVQYMAVRG